MKEQQERIAGFFETHRARLTQYVRRRIRDVSDMDAEDIVADVLLDLFHRAGPAIPVENLAAYIYQSMANRIADYRRRKRPTVSLDQTNGEDEPVFMENLTDPSAGMDQVMESKDLEIEGRTFKELSTAWHEPMGTLLSCKSRAVKALQVMLKETLLND